MSDFDGSERTTVLVALSVPIGLLAAAAAWSLLSLIGLLTNVVFYQRIDTHVATPDGSQPWWLTIAAPVAGGLVVGAIARTVCPEVRGHGLPETIQAVLTGRARISPRVAAFKPIASGAAIGTGGPFGAEGPIIMTGGALGSLVAQLCSLTLNERRILLICGSAAGMAAALNAPLASIIFAAELLLFEWRQHSLIPVCTAVCVGTLARFPLLGSHHEFAMQPPAHHGPHSFSATSPDLTIAMLCLASGLLCGLLAVVLTNLTRASEAAFHRLPLHWMWWPAIGGLAVGVGGLIAPEALAVGYDVIAGNLRGSSSYLGETSGAEALLLLVIVKSAIWPIALGSGTAGGVLAPIFVIGTSVGALEALVLPEAGPGFWSLVALAGVLSGLMRAPMTAIVFALEITGRWDALVPVTLAAGAACVVSSALMRRSILTEKVARVGFHLSRDYVVDPLRVVVTAQVMHDNPICLLSSVTVEQAHGALCCASACLQEDDTAAVARHHAFDHPHNLARSQRLFPVLSLDDRLIGVLTLSRLQALARRSSTQRLQVSQAATPQVAFAHEHDSLAAVAEAMASHRVQAMPVFSKGDPETVVGVVTLPQLLQPRAERRSDTTVRERLITVRKGRTPKDRAHPPTVDSKPDQPTTEDTDVNHARDHRRHLPAHHRIG